MRYLSTPVRLLSYTLIAAVVLLAYQTGTGPRPMRAQEPANDVEPASDAEPPSDAPQKSATASDPVPTLNIVDLFHQGGIFMWPILGLSLIGLTFTIERLLGLRRNKIIPDDLVTALSQMGSSQNAFDPRKAYRLCQQFPSAAAVVIRAMLQKVGRPHSEIEHAVAEASNREAERLYANVRWINLCVSVAPLLGLLGTVQGMILCFHQLTLLDPGDPHKATKLAEGVYTALVTTFAGLVVAIPAALISHYFEGRIQTLFHEVDELLFDLLPQLERFEGRVRLRLGEVEYTSHEDAAEPAEAVTK